MQHDRLNYLVEQAIADNISNDDRNELLLLLSKPENRELYDQLFERLLAQPAATDFFTSSETASMLERIERRNNIRPEPRIRRLKQRVWWAAASVAFVAALAGYQLFYPSVSLKEGTRKQQIADAGLVVHVPKEVTLTLADGSRVALDSTASGRVFKQHGTDAVKSGQGTLTYTRKLTADTLQATAFNTLTIPRGTHYKVVLPDGTKVWLNAASSLRYPVRFNGGERRVELNGEAYFEVAQDAHQPFTVVSGSQVIAVLGTAFNVEAYTEDAFIQTTLVSGSIRVDPRNGTAPLVLKPGEKATLENNLLQVKKADTKADLAWMSDLFSFSDTDLRVVLRQLQRWYDIEVDYSSLPPEKLYGQLPRSTPLPQLLKAIEKTTNLKFKLNNNRLIVDKL
ncbi:FecR domain-containing protein [Chitinophaga sp. 212800008-4]|uniref:FecR family protein n=1 Tax=unclassified Chitinophaga TaxID=2619133 RepID=UPI0030CC9998